MKYYFNPHINSKLMISGINRFNFWVSAICILLIVICFSAPAQRYFPQDYFNSPLDIPLKLSGNFGEIRPNHFHSGLDLKTDSVEGKRVYVVADGFVSRIKVSAFGYGNALYITHPNGYVSVYAHLQRFSDSIARYVDQKQYERESFEIELFPDSNLFVFKKGDVVAFSGNSGGSTGPHLHFEIRDAVTENIINPLLFGYKINDTIPPVFKSLCVYENRKLAAKDSNLVAIGLPGLYPGKKNIQYALLDTLLVTPRGQFGFEADDFCDESSNSLGIYKVSLTVNDSLIWQYEFNTFSFDETRYVNAHIDYPAKVIDRKIYERCFRLPGDSFSIYINQGKHAPNYSASHLHKAALTISDFSENSSVLYFNFKADQIQLPVVKRKSSAFIRYNQSYTIKTKSFLLHLPSKSLYDDIYLDYTVTKKNKNFYSSSVTINDNTIPLHAAAALSIKAKLKTQREQDKALVLLIKNDSSLVSVGGGYKDGMVTCFTRVLGTFAVSIDTVPPGIKAKLVPDTVSVGDTLHFLISDQLSGIAAFNITVNNKVVIPVYDVKKDLLKIPCTRFKTGEQMLKITVTDAKQNMATLERIVFCLDNP